MPLFPVSVNAQKIAQAITDGAALQNVGSVTVYLSNESNPSAANYTWKLDAGSAVQWPANMELWAVTGSSTSQLAVSYGASGAALGSVVANINGPVSISGPVDVSGSAVTVSGNVNVTNAVIPVSGNVNSNITNASIAVTGSVNAAITNASIPVTGNVNATITNASLTVGGTVAISSGTVNATITNASIPVTGTVNANITNASLAVSGNVNANITGGTVSISSGSVNVGTIAGNVTVGGILTPVVVQGGGQLLYNATVPSTTLTFVTIPVPANSAYNSIRVTAEHLSGQPAFIGYEDGSLTTGSPTGGGIGLGTAYYPPAGQQVGVPGILDVSFPSTVTGSFQISVSSATTNTSVRLKVYGMNVAVPALVTNISGQISQANVLGELNEVLPTAVTDPVYFPSSTTPYTIRIRATAGTALVGTLRWEEFSLVGGWQQVSPFPHYDMLGAPPPSGAPWVRYFNTPGSMYLGRMLFLFNAGNTGSIFLSMCKAV